MTTENILLPVNLNHGFLTGALVVSLVVFPFVASQADNSPPAPPSMSTSPDNLSGPRFNPSMVIIMVVLIGSFFLMGFCSVYLRQLANRRYARSNLESAITSAIGGGGSRRSRGLDAGVIETFPIFPYSSVKNLKIGKGTLECAVCLNEFEDDETLRLIPKCSHVFHPECIDAWLSSHTTCPVCRANLVPKPDDMPFAPVQPFEPLESYTQEETHNRVTIQISDDDQCQNREVPTQVHPQTRTPEVNLLNPTARNRPPRSWSTGWRFSALFPRSHSTGHSLVQHGENLDRFTLRLPDEVRNQLLNTHLNRAKSCVAFPRARSTRRGYRSRSGGIGQRSNNSNYERFDQDEQPDRCGLTMVPPFISKSGSVRSSKGLGGGSDEVNGAPPPKNFTRSVKSPFDFLVLGIHDIGSSGSNNVGERSSDRLRSESQE